MKTSKMIRLIDRDGWQLIRQTGSHRIYRHPVKKGSGVVPAHGAKELQ